MCVWVWVWVSVCVRVCVGVSVGMGVGTGVRMGMYLDVVVGLCINVQSVSIRTAAAGNYASCESSDKYQVICQLLN